VGRGIAAGKGKTAGRGTKGQKARAGASIPAWFEGGQTPIHMRVPKLRGFRRLMRIEYQVVNVGRISAYAEAGRLGDKPAGKAPYTVNPEILRAAGLISKDRQAVKVLGSGDVGVPIFVLADAFTRSARDKIESAGGSVQLIAPPEPQPAPTRTRSSKGGAAAANTGDVAAAEGTVEAPEGSSDPEAAAEAGTDEAVAEAVEPTTASADDAAPQENAPDADDAESGATD
jgi:large subunit ribosomal protein L15